MSNTIKMMARRKNRREKGSRAEFFGSNPHSNGEVFSRSLWLRALKIHAVPNTALTRARANNEATEEYSIN
jgi:hypothetical protein